MLKDAKIFYITTVILSRNEIRAQPRHAIHAALVVKTLFQTPNYSFERDADERNFERESAYWTEPSSIPQRV